MNYVANFHWLSSLCLNAGESCSDTSGTINTLKERIENKSFIFDCYDIYNEASDTSQTAISCVSSIVDNIQQGIVVVS